MNRDHMFLRSGPDGDRARTQVAEIGIRGDFHLHQTGGSACGADFGPLQARGGELPFPVAFDRKGDLSGIGSRDGEFLLDTRNMQFIGSGCNPVVVGARTEKHRCKERKQHREKVGFEGVHNESDCKG